MIGQLFTLLELAAGRAVEPVFDLTLAEEWPARAASLLPAGPIYIGRAPGAGGAHKRWPREHFVGLAQAQLAAGRIPVFLLGPDEAAWHGALRDAIPGALFPLQAADEDAAPPLLTLAVAQRLAAAVANDSGTGHLIAAAGSPLVSLFGPTRAEKFAPAARRLEIVDAQSFGSSAMAAIPLAAVATALERLLADSPGTRFATLIAGSSEVGQRRSGLMPASALNLARRALVNAASPRGTVFRQGREELGTAGSILRNCWSGRDASKDRSDRIRRRATLPSWPL
jgi:hypothetical protein